MPTSSFKALTPDTADARVQVGFTAGTPRSDDAFLTIQRDVLTDLPYYDQCYPDLAAADVTALDHYNQHGWREGRDPTSHFCTSAYAGGREPATGLPAAWRRRGQVGPWDAISAR